MTATVTGAERHDREVGERCGKRHGRQRIPVGDRDVPWHILLCEFGRQSSFELEIGKLRLRQLLFRQIHAAERIGCDELLVGRANQKAEMRPEAAADRKRAFDPYRHA